jgi:hypothetical protein
LSQAFEPVDLDRLSIEMAGQSFDQNLADPSREEAGLDLGDFGNVGIAKDEAIRLAKLTLAWVADLDRARGLVGAETWLDQMGDGGWPFKIRGRVDALYGQFPEDGDGLIVSSGSDLKTARDSRTPSFGVALQMGIYSTFLPVPWFVDVMPKTKVPNPVTYVCDVNNDQRENVRALVLDVAERLRNGDFPARPGFLCHYSHGEPTFSRAVTGFGE